MTPINPVSDDVTSRLVTLALNAALARHGAIATNIANANNEDYRPLRVDFDAQLALVQGRLVDRRFDASAARLIDSLNGGLAPTVDPQADKVQIDAETAHMVQNAVHYQSVLAAYNKMLALTRMAISGGRQ